MVISVSFSVVIYRLSYGELGRGLARQMTVLRDLGAQWVPPNFAPRDFDEIRMDQIRESSASLRNNLIYLNLLILFLSSVASYYFAKVTLRPIEEASEAQKRFTADASHELRTPLAAMRSEVEVGLRDRELTLAQAKKLLNSSLEEIGKLESLSTALLHLARYKEQGASAFENVALDEVLADAYSKVEKLAEKKCIVFENKAEAMSVPGDQPSLAELFAILFENAVKYSPKNSKVLVSAKKHMKHVEIDVVDHGVGIKESDLPYIFNRFYRADHSRQKGLNPPAGGDGYGLGLSIAQAIVELHNGKISAKSTPGQGSQFRVELPL
jgi:signal transduction histidine kinase